MTSNTHNIQDIINNIADLETPVPPTIQRFTGMDGYFDAMKRAMAIIKEYQNSGNTWEPERLQQDMLVLSAIHSEMAEMVGYLQGMSSRAESTSKVVTSQYVLDIKKHRDDMRTDGKIVRVNDEDIKAASKVMSKDAIDAARDFETISRIITNAWYAISSHVEVLRSALKRAEKEFSHS
jgi:hypothetical protein